MFSGEAKARVQGELDRAKSGAAVDAKDIATADKQLAAAKTGNEMVGIGKLYFSAGDYQKAADALQKGLARGGVQDAATQQGTRGEGRIRRREEPDADRSRALVEAQARRRHGAAGRDGRDAAATGGLSAERVDSHLRVTSPARRKARGDR